MKSTFISGINILLAIFLMACNSQNDKKLEQALERAKENRQELEKVLDHYKKDSTKLAAARFLIENMPYHFTLEQYYTSPRKEKYRPDITLFDGFQSVKRHCDSLANRGYRIETHHKYDISKLNSSFLIDNIELAFAVWKKPWAKNVSFTDFCRYILPYRAQYEEVSNLRKEFMERFLPLLDSADVKTPLEACIVLRNKIEKMVRYEDTGLSLYPTISETYRSGIGTCEGLCNFIAYAMRSAGIPVIIDQTTWVKMDRGHCWCAVLDNGHFLSFGENLAPGVHARLFSETRTLRPAKVYRLQFEPNLTEDYGKNDDGYAVSFKNPLIQDVTTEYLDKPTTIKVTIDMDIKENKRSNQVYLCNFNYNKWTDIALGYRKDSICYFNDVVGDNIFMVADVPDGNSLRFITAPFYVSTEGEIHKFIPDIQNKSSYTIHKRPEGYKEQHTLSYWDTQHKKFTPIKYVSETDTTLFYNNIPGNTLLWLYIPIHMYNQRAFFLENDSMRVY